MTPRRMTPYMVHPELIREIRDMCKEKGWRENIPPHPRTVSEPYAEYVFAAYVALDHSELTEALEAYRDKDWSDTCYGIPDTSARPSGHHKGCSGNPRSSAKPIGVGPELADVLIRLLDIVDIWGIDINYELRRVIDYGWTREYKHGGRTL